MTAEETAVLAPLIERATAEGWRAWVRTPADELAVLHGCTFDEKRARHASEFFRRFLRHSKDPHLGHPFQLLDWQYTEVIAQIFGWRRADGRRRFRELFLFVCKKQGKTTLMAGLLLYHMLYDGTGLNAISAAGDKEQASLIYDEAVAFINGHPAMKSRFRVYPTTKRIICQHARGRANVYKAISSETFTKEGLDCSLVIQDETHAWPGREMFDVLAKSTSARPEGLMITTTTAGEGQDNVAGEQYTFAQRWRQGHIEMDSYLAVIYEADRDGDDWRSEATWRKACPSMDHTVSIEVIRDEYIKACHSPAEENKFRRYRLNQWVSVVGAWIDLEHYDQCVGIVDIAQLAGRECWAGLDLSSVNDTTALTLIFPMDDGSLVIVPRFYLPEDNIDALSLEHKVDYRAWAAHKLFTLTPGNVVDAEAIQADILQVAKDYVLKRLAIDRKFQGVGIEVALVNGTRDAGYSNGLGDIVAPAGQGWKSQDLPMREIEKLITMGQLTHGAHPVLRWHASNAVCRIDQAGNYSLDKKRSRDKIDGIAALCNAVYAWMQDCGMLIAEEAGAGDWHGGVSFV